MQKLHFDATILFVSYYVLYTLTVRNTKEFPSVFFVFSSTTFHIPILQDYRIGSTDCVDLGFQKVSVREFEESSTSCHAHIGLTGRLDPSNRLMVSFLIFFHIQIPSTYSDGKITKIPKILVSEFRYFSYTF